MLERIGDLGDSSFVREDLDKSVRLEESIGYFDTRYTMTSIVFEVYSILLGARREARTFLHTERALLFTRSF